MHRKRRSYHDEEICFVESAYGTKEIWRKLPNGYINAVSCKAFQQKLTDSPKKTISGLTSPLHVLHLGIRSSSMDSFISVSLNGPLHSIQHCVAKLPCASMIFSAGTPARRSRVSMFCVKHKSSSPLSDRSLMNECVRVGLYFPG